MALSAEKRRKIASGIEKFKKKYKIDDDNFIGFLSENPEIGNIERLPSGNIAFDILTNGGFVKGMINEVYGEKNCGKTTLFRDTIAHNQKTQENWLAGYCNNEKTLDRDYFINHGGVNEEDIVIGEFRTSEQSLDFCINAITDGYDALFIDTIQALSPKSELTKGDSLENIKSTESNTIGLLPRLYSQFLRMYTSLSNKKMTMFFGSQVRTDINTYGAPTKQTGGHAIDHYVVLVVKMRRSESKTLWPTADVPPNSYVVEFKIDKSKIMNRYKGNTVNAYFFKGKFDRRFNIIAIGKDLGVHDGRKVIFPVKDEEGNEVMKEYKYKGMGELLNKLPDDAVSWIESQLLDTYNKKVTDYIEEIEETNDQTTAD